MSTNTFTDIADSLYADEFFNTSLVTLGHISKVPQSAFANAYEHNQQSNFVLDTSSNRDLTNELGFRFKSVSNLGVENIKIKYSAKEGSPLSFSVPDGGERQPEISFYESEELTVFKKFLGITRNFYNGQGLRQVGASDNIGLNLVLNIYGTNQSMLGIGDIWKSENDKQTSLKARILIGRALIQDIIPPIKELDSSGKPKEPVTKVKLVASKIVFVYGSGLEKPAAACFNTFMTKTPDELNAASSPTFLLAGGETYA